MKHCFILGITTRSGTNYLYNLLNLHPQTLGRGLLSEDFLLHFSKSLQNYKDQLYDLYRQHPTWDVENNICTKKEFLGFLGRGLLDYLESPYIKNGVVKVGSAATDPRLLITKTPSVRGLKRFFKLFPKAKLIILVRDGRSVTESGVKSFSHSYESLMQRWVQAANTIIEFQQQYDPNKYDYLIVHYKVLYTDTEKELTRVFNFLNLDPGLYDFSKTNKLKIVGSSETRTKNQDSVQWTPKKKWSNFNPVKRYRDWGALKHERFNWLAGKQTEHFGFSLKQTKIPYIFSLPFNLFMDVFSLSRLHYTRRILFLFRLKLKKLRKHLK